MSYLSSTSSLEIPDFPALSVDLSLESHGLWAVLFAALCRSSSSRLAVPWHGASPCAGLGRGCSGLPVTARGLLVVCLQGQKSLHGGVYSALRGGSEYSDTNWRLFE